MQHLVCDVTGEDIPEGQETVLHASGCLVRMIGRKRIDLSKPAAASLARWLGHPIERPELEQVPGPESDLGPFGVSVDPALRVDALQRGTPAGSSPPSGRRRAKP